jgi:predicted nucleic acid-binding protein
MNGKPFLDTNVLIYAFGDDDPRKKVAADSIAAGGVISIQVLNEFVSVARRKLRRTWDQVDLALADLRVLLEPPLPLTIEIHEAGVALARRHSLNIYDALVVASAIEAECSVLLTEDLADGMTVGGVTIRNPFRV